MGRHFVPQAHYLARPRGAATRSFLTVGELAEMTKAEMGLLNSADQPGAYAIDYCDGLDELLQVR